MTRLDKILGWQSIQLAAMQRRLQRGLIRRKSAEAKLRKRSQHGARLLEDSLRRQEDLRRLTRKNLSTQEKACQDLSHLLSDEIAQTLLGINVHLLTLQTMARSGGANLKKEIAITQRVVDKSIRSIHKLANHLDLHRPM